MVTHICSKYWVMALVVGCLTIVVSPLKLEQLGSAHLPATMAQAAHGWLFLWGKIEKFYWT